MNLKFWKRDKDVKREIPPERDLSGPLGGGFGAATGRTGSFGNMGGGGSDTPEESDVRRSQSTSRIGDSSSGRH